MFSGKSRQRVQRFGESLKAPFRNNKSRSPSRSPTPTPTPSIACGHTPAITPDTTLLSNATSGPSSETDGAIVSSCHPAGLAHATGDQYSSSQSLAIAVPLKNEAFQKAIQVYLDNLSNDDKIAFQSATDVMEKLGEFHQGNARNSSSHIQKAQKVLQCVKQFLGSVAICIQHHPEVSSLVVGGLNCILTVSLY